MASALQEYISDHSRNLPPAPGAFTGAAGGAACGDLARISLVVESGTIAAATFDSAGCGATRAACACVCELVEGGAVLEAARLDPAAVEQELGGLSPAKRHAAVLAADAMHRALSGAASSPEAILDRSAAGNPATGERATGELSASPERGRGRVLVALSGGVDSAVAALLEREAGREVVAVTLKLWSDPESDGAKACCSPEAVLGARALSHSLGIPHLTLDLEGTFRDTVVKQFVDGYRSGETPNPCVLCNGEVRIAAMVGLADRLGASHLVTGHYARIVDDGSGPLLSAADDGDKDQGYMLAAIPPEVLERLRFPLAEVTKPEVRALAERHGLPVARKPESQDLCFLAGQGKREFLRRHAGLADRPGEVRDPDGKAIGAHNGHHHYTVGQRRGLGIASTEPLYVLDTDAATNSVTVGPRPQLEAQTVAIGDAVLHRGAELVDRVRLRYRSEPVGARIASGEGSGAAAPGRHRRLELQLGEPFAGVAPGQTAVLMSGERIVGHGTIRRRARRAGAGRSVTC